MERELAGEAMLPDGQMVPLPPEQAQELLEKAEAAERENQQKIRDVMRKLEARRDEVVRGRSDIERRMIDDLRQYEGLPRIVGNKDHPSNEKSSPPRIHRTRSRTDMMEARLSDMLFTHPAWAIKPTPKPELSPDKMTNPETGQPLTPAEVEAVAKAAADEMTKCISDTLTESKFSAIGRKMVRDACRIGTGLLMGPMGALRYKRSFNSAQGQVGVEIHEEPRAEIRYGDPWCFYPELAESAEKAQFAFYLHLMSRSELQEFAKHPKVDKKAVARLLKQEPDLGEVGRNLTYRNQHSPFREETKERYAVWRYTGTLERDEAKCLGLLEAEGQAEEDELLPMPMADMWFCQGEVLRSKISPFEGDYRIPYFVYAPFPTDDSMFGLSLPYHCRDSQRCADAALQSMLHNAAVSSGPLIFGKKEAFQAQKGETMEVNGPRWFWITDPDMSVKDCVEVVQFPNNAEQAMAILDRVLEILDDELNMPQMIGDATASKPLTETASGMAMLMNQMLTVMQRRAAAAADDDVFVPMIERLYWWEMLYGDNEAAKGDYCIEALGQKVLLVKDIRAQQLMTYLQISMDDPEVNLSAVRAEIAKMLDVPVDQFKRSPEELAEMQKNQPKDPETMKAEAAMADIERRNKDSERDHEFRMRKAELEDVQHQRQMRDNELTRVVTLTIEDAKLELQADAQVGNEAVQRTKLNIQQQLAGAQNRLKAEEIVGRERSLQTQVALEKPFRA